MIVHLCKAKVASHIHSSPANKRNRDAEDDIDQSQQQLREADWLAEAKCACVEGPCRRNGHLQAVQPASSSMQATSSSNAVDIFKYAINIFKHCRRSGAICEHAAASRSLLICLSCLSAKGACMRRCGKLQTSCTTSCIRSCRVSCTAQCHAPCIIMMHVQSAFLH